MWMSRKNKMQNPVQGRHMPYDNEIITENKIILFLFLKKKKSKKYIALFMHELQNLLSD